MIRRIKKSILLLTVAALGIYASGSCAGPRDTPDYYLCYNRIGGEWRFGRVPSACDINPWGSPEYVVENFLAVTFDDNVEDIALERERYMQEVHAMLRDSVRYYLLARKPDASDEEISAWQQANFAKAHQETFWTHYRDATDGNLKMVRGDRGHGHGMVQIDDRWHFPRLEEGKGWHLFENIIYGMELYFDAWQDAETAPCLSSPNNWRDRARAAYSVYNGGPSKICRWTDPNDPWARNDEGFAAKYDSRTWLSYIENVEYETALDILCFMEGNPGCTALAMVDPNDPANWSGRQVNLASGESCRFQGGEFQCMRDSTDLLCLDLQYGAPSGLAVSPDLSATAAYSVTLHDKHSCFAGAVPGLAQVGDTIRAELAINVRATPGGTALGFTVQPGRTYQVLDFVVSDFSSQIRYYLIRENDQLGYIYAGTVSDYAGWTTRAEYSVLDTVIIPQEGEIIRVVAENGIKLRDAPNGNELDVVPQRRQRKVRAVVVSGDDNAVYYQIKYRGKLGYIYGGKILNGITLKDWVMRKGERSPKPYAESGDVIRIINHSGAELLAAPGGASLAEVLPGSLLYVFKTEIEPVQQQIYYEVVFNGQRGFIDGGRLGETPDQSSGVVISSVAVADRWDKIRLKSDNELRIAPGEALVNQVPADTELRVLSRLVSGDQNDVYYQVRYNGRLGFVYGGYLSPQSTLDQWADTIEWQRFDWWRSR